MVNRPCQPAPYLAFGKDKVRMLLRILRRIEATSKQNGTDPRETIQTFLRSWFHVNEVPSPSDASPLATTEVSRIPILSASSSIASTSSCESVPEEDNDFDHATTLPTSVKSEAAQSFPLHKEDLDIFFAWAFFGKDFDALISWERKELKRVYQTFQKRYDLTFPKKTYDTSHLFHPRRMTLEPVVPIYRPLIVYMSVLGIRWIGHLMLRYVYGFQKFVTKHGMICWYRPAGQKVADANQQEASLMPMLFFHGIAPGGVVGYLPIVLQGLATEPERPVFLFENISISCVLDFQPLTEKQTIDGVIECLKRFGAHQQNLSLVGHSFGSCPIAWLVGSKKLEQQIKQVVLLDPVAIVLSEPDVMVNFLYGEEMDRIRMVASSEIMTQSYLRRHFAGYNSELFVDEVKCPMLVFCSEQDEIVNSEKVKQEMRRHPQHKFQNWEGVGHGACIVDSDKWKDIKKQMLKQELQIVRAK
ncbi:MAG: hypothetical protein SGBAC_004846 [Bacillariaceae sp.]